MVFEIFLSDFISKSTNYVSLNASFVQFYLPINWKPKHHCFKIKWQFQAENGVNKRNEYEYKQKCLAK